MTTIREGALVLADGATFEGELIGAEVEMTSVFVRSTVAVNH